MFKKMYVDRCVNNSMKVGGLKSCTNAKSLNIYHDKLSHNPVEVCRQFFDGCDDRVGKGVKGKKDANWKPKDVIVHEGKMGGRRGDEDAKRLGNSNSEKKFVIKGMK